MTTGPSTDSYRLQGPLAKRSLVLEFQICSSFDETLHLRRIALLSCSVQPRTTSGFGRRSTPDDLGSAGEVWHVEAFKKALLPSAPKRTVRLVDPPERVG